MIPVGSAWTPPARAPGRPGPTSRSARERSSSASTSSSSRACHRAAAPSPGTSACRRTRPRIRSPARPPAGWARTCFHHRLVREHDFVAEQGPLDGRPGTGRRHVEGTPEDVRSVSGRRDRGGRGPGNAGGPRVSMDVAPLDARVERDESVARPSGDRRLVTGRVGPGAGPRGAARRRVASTRGWAPTTDCCVWGPTLTSSSSPSTPGNTTRSAAVVRARRGGNARTARRGTTAGALGGARGDHRDSAAPVRRRAVGAVPARRSLLAAHGPCRWRAPRRWRGAKPHLLVRVRPPAARLPASGVTLEGARAGAPSRARGSAAARPARPRCPVQSLGAAGHHRSPPDNVRAEDAPQHRAIR
jgi:hypothetical protein